MPELPEVETITNDLRDLVLGDTIVLVKIIDSCNLTQISPELFAKNIARKKIQNIVRLGKSIKFSLTSKYALLVHLKMTGQFYCPSHIACLKPHTHLLFKLKKAGYLAFRDVRKFGVIYFKKESDLQKISYLNKLGIDPLGKNYTLKIFKELLAGHKKRNLKSFLLDQTLVSGIGNIYASEILFKTKINPLRPVGSLGKSEISLLFKNIKSILQRAIKHRGTTSASFKDVSGKKGNFQNMLKVYGRAGESCTICHKKIKKIVQNGRSTFYCPPCQK